MRCPLRSEQDTSRFHPRCKPESAWLREGGLYQDPCRIGTAFNSNGNKGIACGLGNIQKVRDGEPLSGRTNAADDFDALESDDFLD